MSLEVHMFPCLSDNYGFLVHEPIEGLTATIDTPEADAIDRALAGKGWTLTHILNTHHHFDHAGGNAALKAKWGCTVVGAANDAARIPGIDVRLEDGDEFRFGAATARVLAVPGHTSGHIAYHFAADGVLFVGDTLFALGCGRLFEGTAAQMWSSLQKLMALPDETVVYCAHEYTQANAAFALTVDPDNPDLLERAKRIEALRASGRPTVPTTIGLEKATNPFLRATSAEVQARVGLAGAPPVEVFAEVRRRKDRF
jgi:hydroxyacylglutathione hydrolase